MDEDTGRVEIQRPSQAGARQEGVRVQGTVCSPSSSQGWELEKEKGFPIPGNQDLK